MSVLRLSRPDGVCSLFAIGRNGDMFTTTQNSPAGDWAPWSELVDTLKA